MKKLPNISKLVKKAANDLMEYIQEEKQVPGTLSSERILSEKFLVSRTTLVKIFNLLENKGILVKDKSSRIILRKPNKSDFFNLNNNAVSKSEFVEQYILKKLANFEYKPDSYFSELELARESASNTITVREILLKISKTGLIKKEPRQRWQVVALTRKMVEEITLFREILEVNALEKIMTGNTKELVINEFTVIKNKHVKMLQQNLVDYDKFIRLENSMHKAIIRLTDNRYMKSSYESIFTIVQYHIGQPGIDRADTKENIKEHLVFLNAIINWDKQKALSALKFHLKQAGKYILKISDLSNVKK